MLGRLHGLSTARCAIGACSTNLEARDSLARKSQRQSSARMNRAVLEERRSETPGGNRPRNLRWNSKGAAVSKKKSQNAKKLFSELGLKGPKGWTKACAMASTKLGYHPVPVKKGTEFYQVAKKIHAHLTV